MKKYLFLTFAAVFLSCSSDDSQPVTDSGIFGVWRIQSTFVDNASGNDSFLDYDECQLQSTRTIAAGGVLSENLSATLNGECISQNFTGTWSQDATNSNLYTYSINGDTFQVTNTVSGDTLLTVQVVGGTTATTTWVRP